MIANNVDGTLESQQTTALVFVVLCTGASVLLHHFLKENHKYFFTRKLINVLMFLRKFWGEGSDSSSV